MGSLIRAIIRLPLLQPILRPITRIIVGSIAIPLFRLFLRNVVRMQDLDKELEKDLEQWFRGSLVLLAATANMEGILFGWVPVDFRTDRDWMFVLLRLILAVGVIEKMPDQELFAVIHPGPPKIQWTSLFTELKAKWRAIIWGFFCKYLNRTSPAFVIMTAILTGAVGWWCFGIAISQYLVIGLVTSRDKAMDVLGEFDRQVAIRRREIVEEFDLEDRAESEAAAEKQQTDAAEQETLPPDESSAKKTA